MPRTAQQEWRGEAVINSAVSPYYMRLDSGEGGARLYVQQISGTSEMYLPPTTHLRIGREPNFVICNAGFAAVTVRDSEGTMVATIAAGSFAELWALATTAQTWHAVVQSNGAIGISLPVVETRIEYALNYTASRLVPVNLREELAKQFGYVSADGPVALTVTIAAGVVIGGGTPTKAALDTGTFPFGSTILLDLKAGAYIAGSGGAGGLGMQTSGAGMTAGAAGGNALRIATPTTILRAGTIQAGGGGGGGGSRQIVATIMRPGGSGGGGAGAPGGTGGAAIGSPADPSTAGQPGTIFAGGAGGISTLGAAAGGAGGLAASGANGSNGTALGASGGAAGYAIGYVVGVPYSVIAAGGATLGTTVPVEA